METTYTIGISDTPEDTYNYDRIKLSLRRIHPRISEELDAATSAWFEQTIYIVKMIDEFVSNRIRRIPSGAECFGHSRLSRSSGWPVQTGAGKVEKNYLKNLD